MQKSSHKGFTLIEAIVYLALFGILIGGAIVAAYNLFEGSSRGQARAMLQEEGNYLYGKISWALSGTKDITTPPAGFPGSSLLIVKWDTSLGDPIQITLGGATGTDLIMSTSSNPTGQTLNNSNVEVSNLLFLHTLASGNGINPEEVEFSFMVSARTPTGAVLSMQFPTTTISLRH